MNEEDVKEILAYSCDKALDFVGDIIGMIKKKGMQNKQFALEFADELNRYSVML